MKYYSYENFRNDTNALIKKVEKFEPEVIIGIARGGLTLAHTMAEGLNIRNVQTLRTELYDEDKIRDSISFFAKCDFKDIERVLVVDDIADSGKTLDKVMGILLKENPRTVFKSATLFYKRTSIVEPYFWINETTEWIDFFWERDYKN